VQVRIWAIYSRQIVWPQDLCADYGPYSIRNFGTGISSLLVLTVIVAQGFGAWRNRVFALGVAVFWLGLLPVSNFLPLYRPMADRYLYLPLAGVALMLAPMLARFRMAPWAAVLAALPLAVATFYQERIWCDDVALWTATARTNPLSVVAPNNLGCALVIRDRPAEAIPHLERAMKLTRGGKADPYAFLALALDALGRTAEADAAFKKAVSLDARYAQPDLLVKALACDRPSADKLKVIATRN
jgi:tetratricopeptide (TPR) repeat protein